MKQQKEQQANGTASVLLSSSFPIPDYPSVSLHSTSTDNQDRLFVRRIFCVGRNYADHAKEMGGDPTRIEPPFFFCKPLVGSLVSCGRTRSSPSDTTPPTPPTIILPYPHGTQNLHYEVELVIAVGVGYAVGVDLTKRDVQAQAKQTGRPWCAAKGFHLSAPIGTLYPLPGTEEEETSELWLSVNGVERQRGRPFRDMIWSPDEIQKAIEKEFSTRVGVGDLIFTGTPAGVGPLQVGDTVVAGMDGCGELAFTVGPPSHEHQQEEQQKE